MAQVSWSSVRGRRPVQFIGKAPRVGSKEWEEYVNDAVQSLLALQPVGARWRFRVQGSTIAPSGGTGNYLPLGWFTAAGQSVFQTLTWPLLEPAVSSVDIMSFIERIQIHTTGHWTYKAAQASHLRPSRPPRLRLIMLEVDNLFNPMDIPDGTPEILPDDLFVRGFGSHHMSIGGSTPIYLQDARGLANPLLDSALKKPADMALPSSEVVYVAEPAFGVWDSPSIYTAETAANSTQDHFLDRDSRPCSFAYRIICDQIIPSEEIAIERARDTTTTQFEMPEPMYRVASDIVVNLKRWFQRRAYVDSIDLDRSATVYPTSKLMWALIPEHSVIPTKGGADVFNTAPSFVPCQVTFEVLGVAINDPQLPGNASTLADAVNGNPGYWTSEGISSVMNAAGTIVSNVANSVVSAARGLPAAARYAGAASYMYGLGRQHLA